MEERQREQEIGMALACRAYLYRILHLVFGGPPTEESVRAALGGQTRGLLSKLQDVAAPSFATRRFEEQLAQIEQLAYTGQLAQTGQLREAAAEKSFIEAGKRPTTSQSAADEAGADKGFVEAVSGDYARLFVAPGPSYVRPWESPYVGKEAMLFQESTLDVRRFYHEAGLRLRAEKKFPDDHLAAMMDYLARMARHACEAFAVGDDEALCQLLSTAVSFEKKHVLTWVDKFAQSVEERAAEEYYPAFARLAEVFVVCDQEFSRQLMQELAEEGRGRAESGENEAGRPVRPRSGPGTDGRAPLHAPS